MHLCAVQVRGVHGGGERPRDRATGEPRGLRHHPDLAEKGREAPHQFSGLRVSSLSFPFLLSQFCVGL